jgi:spermidine synthase
VLWFRLLGQLLGGSTAAFSTMLASFLAGIALGSAIASRFAKTRGAAALGFALAQLGTGASAWLAFRASDLLPGWANSLGVSVNALARRAARDRHAAAAHVVRRLDVPVRGAAARARRERRVGRERARLRVEHLGSIVGSIGTGYFLLPWLGFIGTLSVAVLANSRWRSPRAPATPARAALAATAAIAALVLAIAPDPAARPPAAHLAARRILHGEFTHFAVGRSSTVALLDDGVGWRLTNNGLPESYIRPQGYPPEPAAAHWLSLLPVLVRPETEQMVIVGSAQA